MKVPVSWLLLSFEKRRLLAALGGISFAVALMLMQIGFRDALFESATLLHDNLDGQLFMVNPNYYYLFSTPVFSERRLYQALAVEGVASVVPVYVAVSNWKNPFDMTDRFIFVIGFDPKTRVLKVPGIAENVRRLNMQDVVIFDARSHTEFGPVRDYILKNGSIPTEVAGRRVSVEGLFELGTSFGSTANLVTSDQNFLRIVSTRKQGLISIGVIRLESGADAEKIRRSLSAVVPDVRVLTHNEFRELERDYWRTSSPTGFIFNVGMFVAVVVGAVIVYQILYTSVADHLAEYATLKAMGYTNWYLSAIVLKQSMMLSALGFLPGLGVSVILYRVAYEATLLPIYMTAERALTILVLTLLMCATSGALAMRKLKSADPADIF